MLTGEGRIDEQTAFGKTALGVARRAATAGKRCIAFCGGVTVTARGAGRARRGGRPGRRAADDRRRGDRRRAAARSSGPPNAPRGCSRSRDAMTPRVRSPATRDPTAGAALAPRRPSRKRKRQAATRPRHGPTARANRPGLDGRSSSTGSRPLYGHPSGSASTTRRRELVLTILSQNSADINAEKAFESLRRHYPSAPEPASRAGRPPRSTGRAGAASASMPPRRPTGRPSRARRSPS